MKRAIWCLAALFAVLSLVPGPVRAADEPFTFGLLLVGPYNDKGYSQAQYEGGRYVEEKLPGSKMIYLDKVNPADRPGVTIPQLVDDLAAKGAKMILAGSDDMKDGIREAAAAHPEISFVHVSGDDVLTGKAPKNLGNVFGRMEYGKMMAGFAAAMTTKTGKIAYLGPLINDETRRLAASVYLGARYAWEKVLGKPAKDLQFKVSWIGFWFNIPGVTSDPNQVAAAFFDGGYDVVVSGIDTPEALIVAKQKNGAGADVHAVSYDYKLACQGYDAVCLGVPYFNWGPEFLKLIKQGKDGKFTPAFEWLAPDFADINNPDTSIVGYAEGAALSAAARAELKKFVADLGAGKAELFAGPLNYQDGSVFLKAGVKATDKQIWYLPQLLEGMDGQSVAK
ncbi:BMP family lipoprotein [Desulfolutivibrio sp.]|uniref:BMP family lipoprotein n=1 Tax=Desulfolutivibrio sp. TaxID=2773296 RepID=UPI002F9620C7